MSPRVHLNFQGDTNFQGDPEGQRRQVLPKGSQTPIDHLSSHSGPQESRSDLSPHCLVTPTPATGTRRGRMASGASSHIPGMGPRVRAPLRPSHCCLWEWGHCPPPHHCPVVPQHSWGPGTVSFTLSKGTLHSHQCRCHLHPSPQWSCLLIHLSPQTLHCSTLPSKS